MLNKSKLLEFFDASKITKPIHIVGCGAIGSHVGEMLARMGCTNIHLWDFDRVEPHNITNQMFNQEDIGQTKIHATAEKLIAINSELKSTLIMHHNGWDKDILNGYVFLCVDNIELRQEIVKTNMMNPNCIAFFDFRMRLTDAQHYAAIRADSKQLDKLLGTMDFTHDEAKDATPKSACGTELNVIYTVKTIVSLGVSNFVRCVQGEDIKSMILVDLNQLTIDAF